VEQKLSSALEENDKCKIEIETYLKEIKELNEMKKTNENEHMTKLQEELKLVNEELSVNDLKLRNLQSAYDILKHENDDIQKERIDSEENFNQYKGMHSY
jgi:chromosome segregation ATPase